MIKIVFVPRRKTSSSMKRITIIFSLTLFHLSGSIKNSILSESIKNPIILIPGLGCSQIEVKIDENADIKPMCKQKSNDYFTVWVNILYGLTHTPKCIYDSLRLTYDVETRETNDFPGIHTRIPGFGNTNTIDSLTTIKFMFPYFKKLVKRMTKEGYSSGSSIKAAPFDFRKGPTEHSKYFERLKQMIEETYESNEQKRIVLIVHSLGGPLALLFLRKQSKEWREQYIRFMISLSGAWGGAVKALESYYRGFGLRGLEFTRKFGAFSDELPSKTPFPYVIWPAVPLIPKKLIRTWPGFIWMFPSSEAWKKTDTLVRIKDKSYALENMEEFFKDLDEPKGWETYKDIYPYVSGLSKPDVELHCLYGSGVPTVASVYSKDSFRDLIRFPINGDGDGVVNIQSLEVCKKWTAKTTHDKATKDKTTKVTTKAFRGVNHSTILSNSKVLDHVVDLIRGTINAD